MMYLLALNYLALYVKINIVYVIILFMILMTRKYRVLFTQDIFEGDFHTFDICSTCQNVRFIYHHQSLYHTSILY